MGPLAWTLADFPQGYVLLLHKSPHPRRMSSSSSSSVPRRDFYLYGITSYFTPYPFFFSAHKCAPFSARVCVLLEVTGSTDVPSFASPLEFVKHAEWLMRGSRRTLDTRRAPRCACKYCDYTGAERKQSVISRELRAARARVLASMNEESESDELETAAAPIDDGDGTVNNSGADAHADAVAAEV
jgi:Transcription-silencing protein, cryptic loci regulator Clr2